MDKTYVSVQGKWMKIWQCKYLNNIVEQDHRFIKKKIRPMLGFKLFRRARVTLGGIETVHMIRKGQMKERAEQHQTFSQQFYPWTRSQYRFRHFYISLQYLRQNLCH
jgi:hypothetical protein